MNLFLQIIAVALLLQFDLIHSNGVTSIKKVPGCQFSSLKLKCNSMNLENVTWFKNNVSLDVSGDRMTVESETSESEIVELYLIINDITIDDEGHYSCIDTTNPSPITVCGQLIPLNTTTNITVYPGGTFVIECGIKFGSETPKEKDISLKLMFDVDDASPKTQDDTNLLNPTITLNYSSYDRDRFFCRVISKNGNSDFYVNASTSGYNGPWYHIKYAPEVSIDIVREGCNVVMICNTSHPIVNKNNIHVRWLKNGKNMTDHNLTISELIINASEQDIANYTCIAEVDGVKNSASRQLEVPPCFNGTVTLMDCHRVNISGSYPYRIVVNNMMSSEDGIFDLPLPTDNLYLNISYNVSGILGPIKQINSMAFQNCYKETILFAINISINPKQCENISKQEREKNHLVEDFFQNLTKNCRNVVCPNLTYSDTDLKCDNSRYKAILSMTVTGPNSLRFLKRYCNQLDNDNTGCSATPFPTETPSPTPSPTETKSPDKAFSFEHIMIFSLFIALFVAIILLVIIILIFCLVKVKGKSKSCKIDTSNQEHQGDEPGILLDTLAQGNPLSTHTNTTIAQHSQPLSLSSCTINSNNTGQHSIQSGVTRSTHDGNPCCALPLRYHPPPFSPGHMICDESCEQKSSQSGLTRSSHERNPHCASPPHHHPPPPPGHMMSDNICKQCYPTVSCHSYNRHHCYQCHPVCYCSGCYPCHKQRPIDIHMSSTFNGSDCTMHQGGRYIRRHPHPSSNTESQMDHDSQSLIASHASSDTGHGTQYTRTTSHSQESESSKQDTNISSGYDDKYTFNPHKRAGYTIDKTIEQFKKHSPGFQVVDRPVEKLSHSV